MIVHFQITYHTKWGEQIAVCGNLKELGSGSYKSAPVMQYQGDGIWQLALPLKKAPVELEYAYYVLNAAGEAEVEGGQARKLRVPRSADRILLRDKWKVPTDFDHAFFTAAFKDVIFRQEKLLKPRPDVASGDGYVFQFNLSAARIPKGMQFALTGSLPQLGNWNTLEPLLLGNRDYPLWSVSVVLPALEPFEYKYGLYNPATKEWVAFEEGPNRTWEGHFSNGRPAYVLLNDVAFQYPIGDWKGAGVAIPVFSLRSGQSLGVGEFRDLERMSDWASAVGLKMLQILPVNDTTVNYSWTDSYPYSAISVFALHPIFLAIDAIPGALDLIGKDTWEAKKKALNSLPEVDYDAVIQRKRAWGQLVFKAQKKSFLESPAFLSFFEANKTWLEPYAVFCYLRDHYQTADFSQWGAHATYSEGLLRALADPGAAQYEEVAFAYFQQFYLDQQLRKAAAHARQNGVAFKGDLPIGIYRHSADAWVAPQLYNMNGQAGAPPDPFSENGQNWGFPTYNWDEMAKDNFLWWRQRMQSLANYFDAYRIDHILGFFRIWEIPVQHVEGLMGRFRPAIPVYREEFDQRGIFFDKDRFCRPYITAFMLEDWFEEDSDWVRAIFLEEIAFHQYDFKQEFNSQRKVEAFFQLPENSAKEALCTKVYRLFSEVLFFEEPGSDGREFHPRIDFPSTRSFQVLAPEQQDKLRALHHDYFYSRQDTFWRDEAMQKLPALKAATNMLICGEDLGMVPASVPGVMRALGILSLEIQRMSKNPATEFLQASDIPYLSVTSPSTHDMSPVRAWWEESDKAQMARFYRDELHFMGEPPYYCEPYVAKAIIRQHLQWHNMWTIFPLQDLLAMDAGLRREDPFSERINVPANPKHYWRYRMHVSLDNLIEATEFNTALANMLTESGRNSILP